MQRSRKRTLRRMKRRIAAAVPPAGRLIEVIQYNVRDRARSIADANTAHLGSLPRYDLIFAHDVPVMPLAARLKEAWGSHLISDLHEVFPEQDEHFTTATARRYWRSVEAAGLAVSDGIICVNDAVADYVEAQYSPSAPSVVVHNSVPFVERADFRGATLREYFAIPEKAKIMLFAGSLRPHANLEILVDGFGQAELEGWVLAILGQGSLQGQLEAMVQDRGLSDRVFLGRHAPQHQLIAVTSSADVGLLPYQAFGFNHLIATPNKLFEYIQARLPIASSRLPMVERIIRANGNGAFVDYSTPGSTARDLRRFVSEALGRISPDNLEAAARQFSWQHEEVRLVELVEKVMQPPAG